MVVKVKFNHVGIFVENISNAIDQLKEIIITEQGNQYFVDIFREKIDPRKNNYYWLDGKLSDSDKTIKYDGFAIANNYISITPLKSDMTSYSHMKLLKKYFN